MIISELRVYDFRQFKSVDGAPGLKITFHKGLNALIGENDSGKTAVIDALKLVLLTQSNEYIRPSDDDFYKPVGEDACSEFKIDCTISEFTQNEAKTLSNIFRSTRLKMVLNIRLNSIIAHGKKDIRFIRNCVWAI